MLNRNKMIFSTLLLLTLIYAASVISASAQSEAISLQTHKNKSALYVALKDRCGFTDEQIRRSKEYGKNAFDLAAEKGITKDRLKALVYEEKCRRIDEKVSSGKITAEKAEKIKLNLKEHIDSWDGSFKIYKHKSKRNRNDESKKL